MISDAPGSRFAVRGVQIGNTLLTLTVSSRGPLARIITEIVVTVTLPCDASRCRAGICQRGHIHCLRTVFRDLLLVTRDRRVG